MPRLAHRALQNPDIFTSDHYRQAAVAVAAGIGIKFLVSLPVRSEFNAYPDTRLFGEPCLT
jgi:hypothetical protein